MRPSAPAMPGMRWQTGQPARVKISGIDSSPVTNGTISGTTIGGGDVFATGVARGEKNVQSNPSAMAARTSALTRRSDMEGMLGAGEWAFDDDHVAARRLEPRSLTNVHRTTKADGAVLVIGLGGDPGSHP